MSDEFPEAIWHITAPNELTPILRYKSIFKQIKALIIILSDDFIYLFHFMSPRLR